MGDDIVEDEDDEISCIEGEAAKLQEKLCRGGDGQSEPQWVR